MVMNIHIYGTFEKESQWRGASDRSGHIYIIYTYTYTYTYISKTYIDAEFDVESFGMVYLASKGCLNKVICEKHTFLNVCLPPTARVSLYRMDTLWGIFLTLEVDPPSALPPTCTGKVQTRRK